MQSNLRAQAELQAQRKKLANSYKQLLDEFNATDLKTVGNYTLGRLIGKGSFGKVYLATHKLTNGSKVVLKSAKKDDANLAREIHHHRQFLHPHIARLYEVIVTESLVWLVLEYCQGDELYNYLLEKGPIEPAKAQKIFTQLVGAVSYVHNKSCVHRDLKLENILLDKYENVKLVDFGFTREYEGKSSYLQTWCGTVCYSAPEMLKGEKYAGEKVDVWSLGIILYALLAGELPFDDDDETVTKMKILKEEPMFPSTFPPQAKELVQVLLSKRPLLRPSLADILQNPWLAEHAPRQQEILKLQQPAPFTTDLEKEVLQRMRAAGVDIDMVIENVLAQRCDSLAGWWALLSEKEERKARRRERKRKEREAEAKSLRRLSAASGRLDKLAPTIKETDEEGLHSPLLGDPPKSRGRALNRTSVHGTPADLPRLPESHIDRDSEEPPPPIEKDHIRNSDSSSRPPPPPKELGNRRSRSSMLQVVSTNPDLLHPNGFVPKRRRKYQQPFINHLASLRNWIKETSKRARSPGSKASSGKSPTVPPSKSPDLRRRLSNANRDSSVHAHPNLTPSTHFQARPRVSTAGSGKRPSVSPSPLTPRSSYRRSSGGLRGRKSTSSSISSIRSMPHHHHSHSKASSTSSASLASPAVSTSGHKAKSPHSSVKVLPATPTNSTFPSNIRVVRAPLSEGGAAFGTAPPPSPGLIFAKRKRSPFKGPMLNLNIHSSPRDARGPRSEGNSRSGSVQGRRSGEIMGIEEEDEDEFEEVDEFSPVMGKGEVVVMEEKAGPLPPMKEDG
ncbi:Pkinase-domain-containing protein [Lindgomyces ingoldianus]|uniref:Pkinase-domain-containing protein n=1 Tax=Lindgomyces ingoldianus TaxID=673940 RepID=A0ACB6R5X7_9PLEO|nr:Pkinase-domain-containing protein [Lindgomyces ingoldianus]KAF2474693.1 Pkinase-domain-containing protein [Lindgomyces ingoldianus]